MNKLITALAAIAVITATVLWQQLREERTAVAELQETMPTELLKETAPPVHVTSPREPDDAAPVPQVAVNVGPASGGTEALPRFPPQPPERYPAMARELGLTPEEAADLAAFLDVQQFELYRRFPPGGNASLTPEALSAKAEFETRQKADLEARLGSRYEQWKEYQPTLKARRGVDEIRRMLPPNSPLTDFQSAQLLTVMMAEADRRAENDRYRNPASSDQRSQLQFAEQRFRDEEASNRRILESARYVLGPEQFASMESAIDGYTNSQRASLQQQREQLEQSAR